ncbi:hypothetical protein A2Y83_00690 [Candidatus Falkowbacteria bacterium RBG_13_39_14]|uniref:N-acetyltransferase domain-containing protein n=1 Tax=Candidatus Falkowbacteria bacterium RBG_13_39_14 TaxID=1797985 RepID=A0A1F5S0X8_9BACT|nr:MAG: hypothetical protein A2Y83_00690 [Candidatus Falkowbacteria bacterium RBG_13_39_14]
MIKFYFQKNKIIAKQGKFQAGYLKFSYPKDLAGYRNIEIDYIYVKPKYRRIGIATQMIKFFLKKFKNIVWVSLWTGRQMEIDKSYNLYKKLNFKQLAYQADYYDKNIGTRLFVKRILK